MNNDYNVREISCNLRRLGKLPREADRAAQISKSQEKLASGINGCSGPLSRGYVAEGAIIANVRQDQIESQKHNQAFLKKVLITGKEGLIFGVYLLRLLRRRITCGFERKP